MKKFCIAFACASAFASPALAQDGPPQGFRVEAIATADLGSGATKYNDIHAGGVVGYDIRSGNAAFGIEAEVSSQVYAGVRAGVAVGPGALLYVKGGYANARVQVFNPSGIYIGDSHVDGFRVGAGAEIPLSKRFFVKGEYRYSRYDRGIDTHQVAAGVGIRF